jgi:Holliday junction resolvase RusA-like endonuclease
MSDIRFKIDCIPPKATHQASLRIMKRRDGGQFIGKFANSNGKKAQTSLMSMFMPYKPQKPLEGALKLSVVWVYPYRATEPKKNRTGLIPCTTRPDSSNLIKMPEDILTKLGFIQDDSQFSEIEFKKFYGENPYIEVSISKIL